MSDPTHELTERVETGLPSNAVLHPAVEKMLEQNPTPETLREIMAMQREHEASEAKKAFAQAFVALKRDLPKWIDRDVTVDFSSPKGRVRYTHSSLAKAMEEVTPHLTEHGFSLSWTTETKDGKVCVTAELLHRLGHSKTTTLEAPPDSSGSKSTAQGIASTITLLERYSGLAVLGMATKDMKEPGDGATGERDASHVDSARNMKALREIIKRGHTREEAEKIAGKQIQDWTETELDKLRAWLKPKDDEQHSAEEKTGPGEGDIKAKVVGQSAIKEVKVKGKKVKMYQFQFEPEGGEAFWAMTDSSDFAALASSAKEDGILLEIRTEFDKATNLTKITALEPILDK